LAEKKDVRWRRTQSFEVWGFEETKRRIEVKTVEAKGVETIEASKYVFDNAGGNAQVRYRGLSDLYDANSIRHIERRGVERGWSCLEVGGGGGSIASWLCARVGVTGRVLATDIDPRFLETLSYPNLEVRRHDIRREDLPNRQFDLAHVRLVLMHLADPEMALRRIVEALKPGGWLVVEEFDCLTFLPDPAVNPSEINLKTRHAFHRLLSARGVDLRYGRLLPQKLQANGLVNIGAEASVSTYSGKSAGTSFVRFNFEEMRESMLGSRLISQEEFEADLRRIDDQNCLMPLWMMWTVWGQRP
jgi:SAM-dependent methyltransferase